MPEDRVEIVDVKNVLRAVRVLVLELTGVESDERPACVIAKFPVMELWRFRVVLMRFVESATPPL
jgi:hypothetical protein